MTGDSVDEAALPEQFQEGLQALRRRYPSRDIDPVVERGNFVVVSLGTFDVEGPRFEEDGNGESLEHTHDEYAAFARLPRSFPDGNIYGFATSPPIAREERAVLNNDGIEKEVDDPLEDYVDGEVETYSWDWDGHPTSKSEHMALAVDLAEAMLAYG